MHCAEYHIDTALQARSEHSLEAATQTTRSTCACDLIDLHAVVALDGAGIGAQTLIQTLDHRRVGTLLRCKDVCRTFGTIEGVGDVTRNHKLATTQLFAGV